MGQAPHQYLSQWWLAMEARTLRGGVIPLAELGTRVGYETEAAFSKAFKRRYGRSPRAYQRDHPHA